MARKHAGARRATTRSTRIHCGIVALSLAMTTTVPGLPAYLTDTSPSRRHYPKMLPNVALRA